MGFKSKFYRILWIGTIAVIAYMFVFSKYMVVNEITIAGTNKVDVNQVNTVIDAMSSERTFFVPKSNFFLFTRERVSNTLTASMPFIKTISKFKRTWPNKVEIEITERDPGFVLESNGRRYLIDDDGFVVTDNPQQEGLPLIMDQVDENFDIGKQLDNTKLVAFILSAHKQWSSKINVPIKETKIPGKASGEVQFVTNEDWGVFFDVNRSVSSQLSSLALILSKEVPLTKRPTLAYIDLRLKERAYYCFKDSPCVAGASTTTPEQTGPEQTLPATIVPSTKTK